MSRGEGWEGTFRVWGNAYTFFFFLVIQKALFSSITSTRPDFSQNKNKEGDGRTPIHVSQFSAFAVNRFYDILLPILERHRDAQTDRGEVLGKYRAGTPCISSSQDKSPLVPRSGDQHDFIV
jgi:hypothetical protein